jgi:hypothetical protein
MPDEGGLGSKLKRLFIEHDGADRGDEARSAAEEVAALAQQARSGAPAAAGPPTAATGPMGGAPPAFAVSAQSAPIEAAKVDFAGIFRAAGLTEDETEQVNRATQLLSSLPPGLPIETQRQIVEGTLRTFGVDPGKIRAACQREQKALDTYAMVKRQDLEKRTVEGQKKLAELQAEMEKVQRALEDRAREQAGLELGCRNQKEVVGRVVSFFAPPPSQEKEPTP